jgi:hypothetical protein
LEIKIFLALAMSLGLVMNAEQAGATVASPGLAAAAATAQQTNPVTQVGWRGGGYGPGWHGGYGPGWHGGGYGPGGHGGWRGGGHGYGWLPFAALGAAAAATGAYYYYNRPYYGPGPYSYGPGPYYGPCGDGPCAPPPLAPLK